jgi:hypothetical protein
MIAHDAEGIEFKSIFIFAFLNGIEQYLTTFQPSQSKFAIITPHRNMKCWAIWKSDGGDITGWTEPIGVSSYLLGLMQLS